MQILVLGMHRSGTSMVTRLVNMMGAYFGPEGSVGEITGDNPKGFWERPEIFKLNEAILAARGCSWQDLRGWSVQEAVSLPDKTVYSMKKMILAMDANRPWVLKDPRLCLLLPCWLPLLEAPVAVIVYRHPLEIARSLHARDRLPLDYGLALWEYYAVTLLNASLRLPRIHVRHAEYMEHPVSGTERLFTWLRAEGVRRIELPSDREIRAFIDPRLNRSRPDDGPAALTPGQSLLCDILQGHHPQTALLRISDRSRERIRQGPHREAQP